jgi:hypothetical protein
MTEKNDLHIKKAEPYFLGGAGDIDCRILEVTVRCA